MRTKFLLMIILFLCPLSALFSTEEKSQKHYDYTLTVCCIFYNDAPWLKEWIEYHKLLGVEHFLLYNNESDDNYLEVLTPYILNGDVTLIDWPDSPFDNAFYAWVRDTQITAYNDALIRMRDRTLWLAVIDSDEFILPLTCKNLKDFLVNYEQHTALAINWVSYGNSYYETIPAEKLMIECLTYRAPLYNPYFMGVKSIVQPAKVFYYQDPHVFIRQNDGQTVESNGQSYIWGVSTNFDKIVVNHYFTRTLDFLYNEKIPRKYKMDNYPVSNEWLNIMLHEANVENDLTISKYIPELRKNMGFDK